MRSRCSVLAVFALLFVWLRVEFALSQVRTVEHLGGLEPGVSRIATRRGEIPDWAVIGDVNGDGVRDWLMRHRLGDDWPALLVFGTEQPELFPDTLSMEHTVFHDPESWLGNSMAFGDAGDVDGDGFDDFLIGTASFDTADQSNVGGAVLVFGDSALPAEVSLAEVLGGGVRAIRFTSSEENAGIGRRAGPVGDLNDDGIGDFAISSDRAIGSVDGLLGGGRLYVIYGGFALKDEIPVERVGDDIGGFVLHGAFGSDRASGHPNGDRLTGGGFVPAGDLNGDGYEDLLVSAPDASRDLERAGSVFVVYGGASIPHSLFIAEPSESIVEFRGAKAILGFGKALAAVGDVDGDGLADFVAGAPGAFSPNLGGLAYLVYGSQNWPAVVSIEDPLLRRVRITGTVPEFAADIPLETYHGFFGHAAAGIGDWNRDGFDDFAVSAFREVVDFEESIGAVYVVFGGPELERDFDDVDIGTPRVPGVQITRPGEDNGLGNVLHGEDVTGDGVTDIVISSGFVDFFPYPEHVYVLRGGAALSGGLRVDKVVPSRVSRDGGTTVRVFGSGFRRGQVVLFGGVVSPAITVVSSAELLVEAPPRAEEGEVDVEVRNGQDVAVLQGGLRYVGPLSFPDVRLDEAGRHRTLSIETPFGYDFLQREFLRSFFGDIDGDGIDDLTVSAAIEGEHLIVFGGTSLPETLAWSGGQGRTLIRSGYPELAFFGSSIALPGDLDGDGFGDLAIAGFTPTGTLNPPGTAIIVFGRAVWEPELVLSEEVSEGRALRFEQQRCGTPVLASAGILSDSGRPSLLIGGRLCYGSEAAVSVYVDGLDRGGFGAPTFVIAGDPTQWSEDNWGPETTALGRSVVGLGDVNGDEFPDFLVGADGGGGHAFIVLGGSWFSGSRSIVDFIDGGRAVRIQRHESITNIGYGAGRAGDFNGDGLSDLLLSDTSGGRDSHGEVFVIFGSVEFGESVLQLDLSESDPGFLRIRGEYGGDVSAYATEVGDWNDDGFADIGLVSLAIRNQRARAHVVYGRSDPPLEISLDELGDDEGFRLFGGDGSWFSGGTGGIAAGDLDGDGFEDIALGEGGALGVRMLVLFGRRTVDGRFLRADVNFDNAVNISDAQYLLNFLFLGGPGPACEDAADINDDGAANIADAQYLLNHLFLGGPGPPAPFPERGEDPTLDMLGCLGF